MKITSPFTFSQSSLQDYSDCPRRFYLHFIEKLNWPAVETEPALEKEQHLREGQLFHRLVQQHLVGIPADRLTRLATSPNLERWWRNYLAHPILLGKNPVLHTELTLSAPVTGQFRLMAKYDLIAIKPGDQAIIYDWKTNARRPRNEHLSARWQTRVYRALLVQAGAQLNGTHQLDPEQVSMIYWFANHPTEPALIAYSAAQYKRDWDALVRMIDEISSSEEFPKTEEEQKCAYCVFRSYCERGISAGVSDDLENEFEEQELNFEQIQEIAF